ncbi:hypothetical protein Emag_003838 [Eimeria magna]
MALGAGPASMSKRRDSPGETPRHNTGEPCVSAAAAAGGGAAAAGAAAGGRRKTVVCVIVCLCVKEKQGAMRETQEETEARGPSPITNDTAEGAAGLIKGPPNSAAAAAAGAAAAVSLEGRGELQGQEKGVVEGGPLSGGPPISEDSDTIRLRLNLSCEEGRNDERGPGPSELGPDSLMLFVGQQVRIHLVDLLRSRLVAVPPSSFACMSGFFRQMYSGEVETDAQLAQLYAQHSSNKDNPSFRPYRRIRGTLTALYSSKQEGECLNAYETSSCGVELCFPVAVTVPLGAPPSVFPSAAAQKERQIFTLFRRWPLQDFLELRKLYKAQYHVDVFLGRIASPKEHEAVSLEGGPLSAVERFASLHPHLLAGQDAAADDPFLFNGSVVAYLETPPTPAAATAAAATAAATGAATAAAGGEGGEARAAAVKKRGRPRKYPKLEYTGAPVEGPSQVQLRPVGGPEGPYGIAVKQLSVRTTLSDCIHGEQAEGQPNGEGVGGAWEGSSPLERARASRARRATGSWKQRLDEASFASSKAERPRGPRVLRLVNPSRRSHACNHQWTTSENLVSNDRKMEDSALLLSGTAPAAAVAAADAAAEERQEPLFQLSCLDQQQQQQQQVKPQEDVVLFQLSCLEQQQQQQPLRQVTPQEDVVLESPQTVSTSPISGVLASPCMPPTPPETGPPSSLHALLRPYYRRCMELLLADLLHCLLSLSYKEEELEERVAAVEKCLALASSPLVEISCLEALIKRFGFCVKAKASLSELDRHTQQGLVEDVLYLSRFLTGETAAAALAGTTSTNGPPSPSGP